MKKIITMALVVLLGVCCSSCGKNSLASADSQKTAASSFNETARAEQTPSSTAPSDPSISENETSSAFDESETASPPTENTKVDVDLTGLSSTMVYSEITNIFLYPEKYIGKTIKMRGQFVPYKDSKTGAQHFACVAADATACCAQGFEFIPSDSGFDPADYPKPNTEITILGNFEIQTKDEIQYFTITNAKLIDPTQ